VASPTAWAPPTADRLLASIQRCTAAAASGAESFELAELVAHEVVELLGADACAVFRFLPDRGVVMVGGKAAPGHRMFTRGTRFSVDDIVASKAVYETGRAVRIGDYSERLGGGPRRVRELGYHTVLGAPIRLDGELWGTITAASTLPDRLPEGSEQSLDVLAGLCSAIVANAETLARLEAQTAEQRALLTVSQTVLTQPENGSVHRVIAREAAGLLGLTTGVLVRNRDGTPEVAAEWHADPDTPPVDAADPIAHRVLGARQGVSIGDPDVTAAGDDTLAFGLPVAWGTQIEIEGRVWGALIVAGERGLPVPPDAADRLAQFAYTASLAVDHAEARAGLAEQLVEREKFTTLVEMSDDLIAVADLDGRGIYLNRGGRRLIGFGDGDPSELTIADCLTPEGQAKFFEVALPALREQGSWQGETTACNLVTGEPIPVSIDAFILHHPISGAPLFVATVVRDLRERMAAEQQLRERAAEVEELAAARRFLLVEALRAEERMRRQIGDALHDDVLQELYAARQDLAEVDAEDEALHRARVAVDAASRQLRDAVRDLHPAVSWTRDLEARVRAIVEQGAERAGFTCKLEFTASATGDADDVVLALVRELVQNVVKHADASSVTVSVSDAADDLLIEVSDDGRGMGAGRPEEALRGGHIGLASARERVDAIGGRFELESTPGVGTRVRVAIPRAGLGELTPRRAEVR
jgi:PAS domain S-box-containing protein